MSLVKEILYITAKYYPLGYRQLYGYVYGEKRFGKNKPNRNSLDATLSRMKRNGLLNTVKRKWTITSEGAKFLNSRGSNIKRFFPPTNKQKKKVTKKLIVAFDIPERRRKYRDWLRLELIGFGFEQIQKSVWFGPSLPKEFVEYLNEENLLKHVRFFRVSENDLI